MQYCFDIFAKAKNVATFAPMFNVVVRNPHISIRHRLSVVASAAAMSGATNLKPWFNISGNSNCRRGKKEAGWSLPSCCDAGGLNVPGRGAPCHPLGAIAAEFRDFCPRFNSGDLRSPQMSVRWLISTSEPFGSDVQLAYSPTR